MPIREITIQYKSTGLRYAPKPINAGADVVRFMRKAFDERQDQEQTWVILLNFTLVD